MTRRAAGLAGILGCLVIALTACVTPNPEPQPPTEAQLLADLQSERLAHWTEAFPGSPPPEIAVVETVAPDEYKEHFGQCLQDALIPGVDVDGAGTWSFAGAAETDPVYLALQRQLFICAQQYPIAFDGLPVLGDSQLEDLYDHYVERYAPCLRGLGFELLAFPSREQFLMDSLGFPAWLPNQQTVRPIPTTAGWAALAQECPLPQPVAGLVP